MKKRITKVIALLLALVVLCTFVTATAFGQNSVSAYSEDVLIQAAAEVIDAYEEHYHISNLEPYVISTTDNGEETFVDYYLSMTCVLKYTSALQLPHVRGLCAAVGIDVSNTDFATLTSKLNSGAFDKTITAALGSNAGYISALSQIASTAKAEMNTAATNQAVANAVASEVSGFIADLEEKSIGEEITLTVSLRAIYDENGNYIKTQYGSYNSYTDEIAGVVPESIEVMLQNGYVQAVEIAEKSLMAEAEKNVAIASSYVYSGTAAGAYAQAWTSNAGWVYCSTHQENRMQDASKYNTSTYPTYYCCNDCANYVSQAMRAGGITTDTTWYPYSLAWRGTLSMQNYFYGTLGLWKRVSLGTTKVGDVLSLNNSAGSYHVGIITEVDTVTRTYSGHTNDRLNQPFNGSTFAGEATSVDYFTFNASEFPGVTPE